MTRLQGTHGALQGTQDVGAMTMAKAESGPEGGGAGYAALEGTHLLLQGTQDSLQGTRCRVRRLAWRGLATAAVTPIDF